MVLKKSRDVVLRDVIRGHDRNGLGWDLVVLVVFSNFSDSVVLRSSLSLPHPPPGRTWKLLVCVGPESSQC